MVLNKGPPELLSLHNLSTGRSGVLSSECPSVSLTWLGHRVGSSWPLALGSHPSAATAPGAASTASPLLGFCETPETPQSCGVPNITRTWNRWNKSRGGCKVLKRSGTPSLWRQVERIVAGRVLQAGEEKVVSRPHNTFSI